MDDEAVQRAVEDVAAAVAHQEAEPAVQHFMSHDLGHRESVYRLRSLVPYLPKTYPFSLQSFSLRREFSHSPAHANKEGRNVYFTLSFAGIALMAAIFVGIAVAKWRTARSPHAQGFIEVDQVSGFVKIEISNKGIPLMKDKEETNKGHEIF